MSPFGGGDWAPKAAAMKAILFVAFGLLFARLFYLQVMRGDFYRQLSENNYTRNIVLRSPRGMILDRNGAILCRNRVSFSLVLDTSRQGDLGATLLAMQRILGLCMTKDQVKAAQARSAVPSLAVIARDVPTSLVEKVEARQSEMPLLAVEMEARREYPYGALLGHSLGYVGLISPEESEKLHIAITDPFIEVGKSGVERAANALLMGKNGRRTAQVNSLGREVDNPSLRLPGVGVQEEPTPGKAVQLTLDVKLQTLLEAAFGEESGSALFMNPSTGEILAWVSMPEFDPNLFCGTISPAAWKALSEDPRHPLLNRPIQGAYPAGSSFKPFVALVGLEEGILTPSTVYSCPGSWNFGGNVFHCWAKAGHGAVDILTAIQNSCNVFFYKAANDIGIERIARWGAKFGLGKPTGVDIPGEGSGVLPSPEWKAAHHLGPWYPGETLPVGIGQGYLTVTPMQLLSFYSTLAEGGVRVRPHIVAGPPEVLERTDVSPSSIEIVKEGLWRVVQSGTGKACRIAGLDVCAKTGTAQVVVASSGKNTYSLEKELRDHAWFAGFAPRKDPQVAFVIMVEHGGHGGDIAAKIAKVGLEYLFFGKEPSAEQPPAAAPSKPSQEDASGARDQARAVTSAEARHAG